jgi:hypothetical protein
LASLPTEGLEARLTEYAGHLAAAECRWLEMVAEYDRRRAYESWGCLSMAYWLNWHCGLDLRSARDKVRVAHALERFELIRQAFAAGRLSYSKVRAITRVASPATEGDLVMLAEHAPTEHVERIVRAYRRCIDIEQERRDVQDRHARTQGVSWWDGDGTGVLYARLDPEDMAVVREALAAARTELSVDGSAEPPASRPLPAQALVALARAYLDNLGDTNAPRYRVMVHADEDVLTRDSDGRCELDDGPALSPDTARRLLCDHALVAVLQDSLRRPVRVGISIDTPARVKRAVRIRDRGCRFPGCRQRRYTDVHHVRWRSRREGHHLDNLVELCWHHHRLVHEGGWDLRVETDGTLTAIRPDGGRLVLRPVPVLGDDEIANSNARAGVTVAPDTIHPTWHADTLDLDHVTTSLMQRWLREHPEDDVRPE